MRWKRRFSWSNPTVSRGVSIGEIVSRFEKKGFKLVAAKLMTVSRELAEAHYAEHREKPFFEELVGFITSGPVFAMIWEGENVISVARQMMGKPIPPMRPRNDPRRLRHQCGDEHHPRFRLAGKCGAGDRALGSRSRIRFL